MIPRVRALIEAGAPDASDALAQLDLSDWPGMLSMRLIFHLTKKNYGDPVALQAHAIAFRQLVEIWDRAALSRRAHDIEHDRHFEFEAECLSAIASYVLGCTESQARQICAPLLFAIERYADHAADFLRDLTFAEDQRDNPTCYWALWQAFADGLKQANFANHETAEQLIGALFLGQPWRDDVRHWRRLEDPPARIHDLFDWFPAPSPAFSAYVLFLYRVGRKSLPESFVALEKKLAAGDASTLLANANTAFCLEGLLRSFVYGRPLVLKSDPVLRSAILAILDSLVESGSSLAYRMRDDFVTPQSASLRG